MAQGKRSTTHHIVRELVRLVAIAVQRGTAMAHL